MFDAEIGQSRVQPRKLWSFEQLLGPALQIDVYLTTEQVS